MMTPNNMQMNAHQQTQTAYDPLAVQFMTGGQMGYMPDAQYLTPSQYGAFRSIPGAQSQVTPQQRPSLWQSYLINNRGNPLGAFGDYTFTNYNMGVDQSMYRTMSQRRVQDAGSAMGATALGTAGNIGASMALGAGNPLIAAGISTVLPDMAAPYIDRISKMRRIQEESMSKIAVGPDMAAGMGRGFSASAAGKIDEYIRREGAEDMLFKEEDLRKIKKLGMEQGLFDYSHSASEYKNVIKKLRDNINVMSEVLGSTDFKELTGEMKRLMTMGSDINQMSGTMHQERMFSRMTGMRHQDMVSTYGQQGALAFSQAGLTNYQGSMTAMAHAAGTTMSQRLGLSDPAMIARHGGVSGLAQELTQQQAGVTRRMQDFYLPYLANDSFTGLKKGAMGDISKFMSGELSWQEMAQGAQNISSASEMQRYSSNRADLEKQLVDKLGPVGKQIFLRQQALQRGKTLGADNDEDALLMGYKHMGYTDEAALINTRRMSSPEYLNAQKEQLLTESRKARYSALEQRKHEGNLFNRVARFGRTALNTMATPYKSWAASSAREKQFEEDLELGVMRAYDVGPDKVGNIEDTISFLGGVGEAGEGLGLRSANERDYIMGGGDPAELGWSSGFYSYSKLGTNLMKDKSSMMWSGRQLGKAVNANMSMSQINKNLGAHSKDFTGAALARAVKSIGGADDLTKNKMVGMYTKAILESNKGMSTEQARKIARKKVENGELNETVYALAKKENEGLQVELTETYRQRTEDAYRDDYESYSAWKEDFNDDLGELTEQTFGNFGADDKKQLGIINNAIEKDALSINLRSMQALQAEYKQNDPNSRQAKDLKKKFMSIAKRLNESTDLDLSAEDAEKLFNSAGGLKGSKALDDYAKKSNLSKEELLELIQTGEDKAESFAVTSQNVIDEADEAEKLVRRKVAVEGYEKTKIARSKLKEADISMEDLSSVEKIQKLLKTDEVQQDKQLRGVLVGAMNMRKSIGKDGDITARGIGTKYGFNLIDVVEENKELIEGNVSKPGEGDALQTLSTSTEQLVKVLTDLSGNIEKNSKVTEEYKDFIKNRQNDGSINLSLF